MRFSTTFQRRKGGSGSVPVLGTDTNPPTLAPGQVAAGMPGDNVMSCRFWSLNGWPVQRVAAYWITTAGSPTVLNGSLYLWDTLTNSWLLVNSAVLPMTAGVLYYFDVPAIGEPTPTLANLPQGGAGSTSALLVMADPGAQVNGTFTVAMAPDVSTIGT